MLGNNAERGKVLGGSKLYSEYAGYYIRQRYCTIRKVKRQQSAIRWAVPFPPLPLSPPSLLVATSVACTTGYTFYLHYI